MKEKSAVSRRGANFVGFFLRRVISVLGVEVCSASRALIFISVALQFGVTRISAEPTFTKDIAPVVFENCSSCHRPGQSGPFSLLTYKDVSKRAKLVAELTSKKIMPPWLPDPAYGHYVGERHLTEEQIKMFADWAEAGAPEGNAADLPPLPTFQDGWTLGTPDLVVQTPLFNVPADGKDVYRNFVVSVPSTKTQYVAAVEFNPGNSKVAHHAFMYFDRTSGSRDLAAREAEPGFEGMELPRTAITPDGHFLGWQPGKQFLRNPENMSWRLYPKSDLVLQMHMQPSGKPETIQSSVAFYFTDKAPTRFPVKLGVTSLIIDIPAGKKDYVISNSFKIPVDLDILSVLPHAHYLGTDLQGYVVLPDGQTNWLIRIPGWNFNWQGDYRLKEPIFAPKGSTLVMRFSYDNSADNPRNPRNPPVRVQYGAQTKDEMGELWVQTLPRDPSQTLILHQAIEKKVLEYSMEYADYRLKLNPNDAKAHMNRARVLFAQGNSRGALPDLTAAAQADPSFDEPRYFLGLLARMQGNHEMAIRHFENAIQINPKNWKAQGNLGLIYLEQRNMVEAEKRFERAIAINPADGISQDGLGIVLFARGKFAEAAECFREAVEAEPTDSGYRSHLAAAEAAVAKNRHP